MKIQSLSWLTFLFLFSCQVKEKPDEWISGLMCRQLLEDINVVITNIDLNYKRDGFQESYLDEINESKKIATWKNAYLKDHTKASLLKYADSIIYKASKLDIPDSYLSELNWDNAQFENSNSHKWVINELIRSRNNYSKENHPSDSTKVFFWALKAETNMHLYYLKACGSLITSYFAGSNNKIFGGEINTIINSRNVKPGEPVFLIVKLSPTDDGLSYFNDFVKINALKFYLVHVETKEKQLLKPVKIRSTYIFSANPARIGNYVIEGSIHKADPLKGPVRIPQFLPAISTIPIQIFEPFKVIRDEK